ncbi:MAG: hypothetical protein ACRDP5_04715 [Streptosporangiaceae bacterium]
MTLPPAARTASAASSRVNPASKLPFRGQVLYMTPQQGTDLMDAIHRALSLNRLL